MIIYWPIPLMENSSKWRCMKDQMKVYRYIIFVTFIENSFLQNSHLKYNKASWYRNRFIVSGEIFNMSRPWYFNCVEIRIDKIHNIYFMMKYYLLNFKQESNKSFEILEAIIVWFQWNQLDPFNWYYFTELLLLFNTHFIQCQ